MVKCSIKTLQSSVIVVVMLDHARQKHRHRVGLRKRLRPNRAKKSPVMPKKLVRGDRIRLPTQSSRRKSIKLPVTKSESEKVNLIWAKSSKKTWVGLVIGAGIGLLSTLAILNWVSPTVIGNWGAPNLYAPLLLSFGLIWFCLARLIFVNPLAIAITFAPVALLSLKLHRVVIDAQLVGVIIALVVLFVLVSIISRQILIWAFD